MTEFEKMVSGRLYDPNLDGSCSKVANKSRRLCQIYNAIPVEDEKKRQEVLKELLPHAGEGLYIQGPLQFDYGVNTYFGKNCYVNFNFVVLDCAPVRIGNDVFFGPNCQLLTPIHPYLAEERKMRINKAGNLSEIEYGKPIEIGDGCWFGAGVTVLPGVKIGKNTIVGAGSVVNRDLPEGVIAAGNPCRVIRPVAKEDSITLKDFLY